MATNRWRLEARSFSSNMMQQDAFLAATIAAATA
jgi:hypothetical protein